MSVKIFYNDSLFIHGCEVSLYMLSQHRMIPIPPFNEQRPVPQHAVAAKPRLPLSPCFMPSPFVHPALKPSRIIVANIACTWKFKRTLHHILEVVNLVAQEWVRAG